MNRWKVRSSAGRVIEWNTTQPLLSAGDPDMYLTLSGEIPTMSNAQYIAYGSEGLDMIVVRNSDGPFQQYCGDKDVCHMLLTVAGFTNSTYSIVARSTEHVVTLQAEVPFTDEVDANTYDYFLFVADDISVWHTSLWEPLHASLHPLLLFLTETRLHHPHPHCQ